jgi:hypothetical protein
VPYCDMCWLWSWVTRGDAIMCHVLMVVVGSAGGSHVCLPKTKSSIVELQAKRDGAGRENYAIVLLTGHLLFHLLP